MQFLDTKPFQHDDSLDLGLLAAMERYRAKTTDRTRQVLSQLQRIEAPVVIGLPETGAFFSATLWSVDAAGDHLVFHAAREPKVAAVVADPGRLWAAAYDGNSKVQFDLRGRTIRQQDDFFAVGSRMPSALFVLPRRTDVRARHADGQEPRVRFRHPRDGRRMLELRVHDISRGGLAVLAHPDDIVLLPGTEVRDAQIEFEPGDVISAGFRVQNVLLHDEAEALFRFGCAWMDLAPEADHHVQQWTRSARRRKQLLSLDL